MICVCVYNFNSKWSPLVLCILRKVGFELASANFIHIWKKNHSFQLYIDLANGRWGTGTTDRSEVLPCSHLPTAKSLSSRNFMAVIILYCRLDVRFYSAIERILKRNIWTKVSWNKWTIQELWLPLNLRRNWVVFLSAGNKRGEEYRYSGTILYLLCIFLRQLSVSFMMHLDFRSMVYILAAINYSIVPCPDSTCTA
jgi:hypothetical protein